MSVVVCHLRYTSCGLDTAGASPEVIGMLRRLRHTLHSKCSAQRFVLQGMRERHNCFHSGPQAAHKLSPVLRTKLQPPTRPQTWSISCAVSFCWSAPASPHMHALRNQALCHVFGIVLHIAVWPRLCLAGRTILGSGSAPVASALLSSMFSPGQIEVNLLGQMCLVTPSGLHQDQGRRIPPSLALLRTLQVVVAAVRRGRTLRQTQALGGLLAPDVCARTHAHVRHATQALRAFATHQPMPQLASLGGGRAPDEPLVTILGCTML